MLQHSHYTVEEFCFLSELEQLNRKTSSFRHERKRRRAEKKTATNPEWNLTQRWLFDPLKNRFEDLREYCIKTASQDPATGDLGQPQYEDFFMSWVASLAKRDTLQAKIKVGEKVQKSVLYWWYRQFIQRSCMKSAQDVLARSYGARTQSEITHNKDPQHNFKNMNRHGFQQAKVVYKIEEASGQTVSEPDYYVEGEESDQLEIKSLNQAIYKILARSYGEEIAPNRYELYKQMVEGRGGFENLEAWAESRGVTLSKLKHQIAHIEKLIIINKEKLGY